MAKVGRTRLVALGRLDGLERLVASKQQATSTWPLFGLGWPASCTWAVPTHLAIMLASCAPRPVPGRSFLTALLHELEPDPFCFSFASSAQQRPVHIRLRLLAQVVVSGNFPLRLQGRNGSGQHQQCEEQAHGQRLGLARGFIFKIQMISAIWGLSRNTSPFHSFRLQYKNLHRDQFHR